MNFNYKYKMYKGFWFYEDSRRPEIRDEQSSILHKLG